MSSGSGAFLAEPKRVKVFRVRNGRDERAAGIARIHAAARSVIPGFAVGA